MFPFSVYHRMMIMANCDNKCNDCKCDKPCDTLPLDAELYVEVDDKTFLPPHDPRH